MQKFPKSKILSFRHLIFSWWEANKRDLPWRHTRDPYKILVSELMLQQTQVSRALPKYVEFIQTFPTIFILAHASTADVLRVWKGMGYNRRALYLKKMADIVVQKYGGVFPQQEKELLDLPGLGLYTARAVLVFAFEKDVAMVDTNIRQIIVHYFFSGIPQKESVIQEVADQLVPRGQSWSWHQALMDYGSLVMPKKKRISNLQPRNSKLPFQQTNRFSRGRIMDLLREGDWKEEELLQEMQTRYQKTPEYIQGILDGLAKDGLLTRKKNTSISLPS